MTKFVIAQANAYHFLAQIIVTDRHKSLDFRTCIEETCCAARMQMKLLDIDYNENFPVH